MIVRRWKVRKSTPGLIGQSPSLWMATRVVRLQAFHEQILDKFEAFLRPPFRLLGPWGWLNLEYLLPSLFFVVRFFSDSARMSKLSGTGDAETVAKDIQKSTPSQSNLFQHIWILHQQVGTQTFPLAAAAPQAVHRFGHTSIKTQSPLLTSKPNVQNTKLLSLWPSFSVQNEGKRRGETQLFIQKPTTPLQVLKSSRLVSALKADDVLEKTERTTTLQNNNLRASLAAEQIGVTHPREPSHAGLALAPMAIKTPGEKKPIPAEASIFPKLELGGVYQTVSTQSLTGTQHQADGRWQRGSDEQELQYAQPIASATAMMARALQNKNKSVSSQSEQFTAPSKPPVSPGLSNLEINRMADQVYRLIARKMQIENERQGKWY